MKAPSVKSNRQGTEEPVAPDRPVGWGYNRAGRIFVETDWKQFTDDEIDQLRLIHGATPK